MITREEKLMRSHDDDGEFETSMLAALKTNGTIEVFYSHTRRKKKALEDKK